MSRYKNRYRIESTRIQHWDYANPGIYFITIMVNNRNCLLGSISKNTFTYSSLGTVAYTLWFELEHHFPGIKLDSFIVMPNHIHGLIEIPDKTSDVLAHKTRHALSLQRNQNPTGTLRYQHQGKGTLSSIVGSYKSAVSKYLHRMGYTFSWQSRFHDHIVRDENELVTIRNYIINNHWNWREDCYYTEM